LNYTSNDEYIDSWLVMYIEYSRKELDATYRILYTYGTGRIKFFNCKNFQTKQNPVREIKKKATS